MHYKLNNIHMYIILQVENVFVETYFLEHSSYSANKFNPDIILEQETCQGNITLFIHSTFPTNYQTFLKSFRP